MTRGIFEAGTTELQPQQWEISKRRMWVSDCSIQTWTVRLMSQLIRRSSGKTAFSVTTLICFVRRNCQNSFFLGANREHFDRKITDLDL